MFCAAIPLALPKCSHLVHLKYSLAWVIALFVPMDNNSSESMMKQAAVVRKHQLANQDLANLR